MEDSAVNCNQQNELAVDFEEIQHNEKRTLWVVILTLIMMVVEIAAGYLTGSMALLADGYHMASHAGALGIAYLVYRLAKSETMKARLSFGSGKLLPLGGYTSAIGLGIVALWMVAESVGRLLNPTSIHFNEAIAVAVLGLVVNLVSAWILGSGHAHHHHHHHDHDHDHGHDHHHDHDHHDHARPIRDLNHQGAFMHILADALTSVFAIVALIAGKYFSAHWLDPLMGIVGAVVILKWAYGLCRDTAWELLDAHPREAPLGPVREAIEKPGARVIDLHIWKVGPGNYACQLVVESQTRRGSAFYRQFIPKLAGSLHLVVEER